MREKLDIFSRVRYKNSHVYSFLVFSGRLFETNILKVIKKYWSKAIQRTRDTKPNAFIFYRVHVTPSWSINSPLK